MSELKIHPYPTFIIKNEKLQDVTAVIKKSPTTPAIWLHLTQGKFSKKLRKNRISLESRFCHDLDGKLQSLIEKKTDSFTIHQQEAYPVFRKSFFILRLNFFKKSCFF